MTISSLCCRLAVCSTLLVAGSSAAQIKLGLVDVRRAIGESVEARREYAALEESYQRKRLVLEELRRQNESIASTLDLKDPRSQDKIREMADELARETRTAERDFRERRQNFDFSFSLRIRKVLPDIAAAAKVDLVLDSASAAYSNQALDLTAQAIAALDKK